MKRFLLTAVLLLAALHLAAAVFPPPGWQEQPDPAASPDEALQGGTFCESPGPSPKSLNYYLDNNMMSAKVFSLLYESLLNMDPDTLEYVPALASKWEISEDGMTFTFWLDPKAKWSDGKPVTAADVEWTYQAIVNPKNLTGPFKYQLERLEAPVILPDGGIRFRAKSVHWQNLSAASGFAILPKHAFADKDFNLINFEFPVVSGPYRVAEMAEGMYMVLEKRADWWRRDYPSAAGTLNFQRLRLRFFADQTNAFDAFLKGELDQFTIYTASQWHKIEERVEAVRKNWIVRQEIHNHAPVGLQGFAMNLRRPLFRDRRVRLALAHLLDREFMNRTMMFNQYFLHKSYWEDLYDESHPCPNPFIAFDPAAARRLLAEAGWQFNAKNGLLEKDGVPFEFTFLNRGGNDRFLAVYNEALKSVGITMNIVNKDWSAWAKDMDEYNFDMTWVAWGSGLFKDPEQLWSSSEGARKGSSNITGFSNPEVDALIEKQKTIFKVAERNAILRSIDAILCREVPYILLWNIDYARVLYWNKFGTPPAVMSKYGQDSAISLWWNDPDRADELREAMKSDTPMAPEPVKIQWEE